MRSWLEFVSIGLILAPFTEIELKLIAGMNPPALENAAEHYVSNQ